MNKRQTIYLVDYSNWETSGHSFSFFQTYTKILLELDCNVVAMCENPTAIANWVGVNLPASLAARFQARELQRQRRPWWLWRGLPRGWRDLFLKAMHWRRLDAALKQAVDQEDMEVTGVLFACFENLALKKYRLPLWLHRRNFNWPWAAVAFDLSAYRLAGSPAAAVKEARRVFHLLNAPTCRALCLLDETSQRDFQNLFPSVKIHLVPDATDEMPPDLTLPLAREILAQAAGRKIVSLLGMQEIRKGLWMLLKTAQKRPDLFFLFAGPGNEGSFTRSQRAEIREFFASKPQNCFWHPQRIPDGVAFNSLVEISDILFCAYLRFPNSSQLMVKAALRKKPVIVSRGYLCAARAEQYNLGVAIDEGSAEQCSAAIDHLLSPESRSAKRGYDEFAAQMSVEKLKTSLAELLPVFRKS